MWCLVCGMATGVVMHGCASQLCMQVMRVRKPVVRPVVVRKLATGEVTVAMDKANAAHTTLHIKSLRAAFFVSRPCRISIVQCIARHLLLSLVFIYTPHTHVSVAARLFRSLAR